jgi:hypothetical protein
VAQGVGPEFKHQYRKKIKKIKIKSRHPILYTTCRIALPCMGSEVKGTGMNRRVF